METVPSKSIHQAAIEGDILALQACLDAGVDINLKNKSEFDRTPLMLATYRGKLETMRWFVQKGADMFAKDNRTDSALEIATFYTTGSNDRLAKINFLLERGASYQHKLFRLIALNDFNQIEEYIARFLDSLSVVDSIKRTPLHYACAIGQLSVVQKFLQVRPLLLNSKCEQGMTALLYAAFYGHLSVVKYLVEEKGVSLSEKDNDGDTALICGAYSGHLSVVKYLVEEKGVSLSEKNNYGNTALLRAAYSGHLSVVKYLVEEKGVSLSEKNNYGSTALVRAASKGHLSVVKYLVEEKGVSLSEKNNRGTTALMLANKNNYKHVKFWLQFYIFLKEQSHNTLLTIENCSCLEDIINYSNVGEKNAKNLLEATFTSCLVFSATKMVYRLLYEYESLKESFIEYMAGIQDVARRQYVLTALQIGIIKGSKQEALFRDLHRRCKEVKLLAFDESYSFFGQEKSSEVKALENPPQKSLLMTPKVEVKPEFVPSTSTVLLQQIAWKDLRVGKLLGSGGFGDVYEATWHGKPVAIKQLFLKSLPGDMKKVFDHESEVMAKCNFPNVIRLFGVCNEVGHYGMVMELMSRGSLYNVLHNAEESLPWAPLRWQIAVDISRGLLYLHTQNIFHRDLKSLNILLDENYCAKISDFGLAKTKIVSSSSSSKSANGGLAGSLRWSAPELIAVDDQINEVASSEADIYSLGMIFWEIASRKLPFEEIQKEMAVALKISQGKKEKIPADCPAFYGELIQRMWRTQSERPTAKEVVEVLEQNPPPSELFVEDGAEKVIVEKAWHFDSKIKATIPKEGDKSYVLVPAGDKDNRKVVEFYQHHGVQGMEIQSIDIIYNPTMNRAFSLKMKMLQERANSPAFSPTWSTESNPDWRQEVDLMCQNLSRPFADSDFPAIRILPLWHGTDPKVLDSLFRTGYADLAVTDAGYFGKGLYSAFEAEYSHRVYSKGALILNWVAFFSAYPVIDGDMAKLAEKGSYKNYDAHFIPVVPASADPMETSYFPTKPKQKPTYTEVVVFDSAQCLPRYVVKLQKVLLNSHGFFKQSHKQINLFEAANDVYAQYISKPYTLETSHNTYKDMKTMDWDYRCGAAVVQRPNHGLAHVLRKACYVPYVMKYFIEHNRNKLSPESILEIENCIPEIQLAILFTVTGRENDCSNHDDEADYFMFRRRSAEYFENYVNHKKLLISPNRLDFYIDAIQAFDYTKTAFHSIMTICHMIDTLRCFDKNLFNTIMGQVAPIIGEENKNKLVRLAHMSILKTGDRVMAMDSQRTYQGKLFVDCSQNVEKCIENINVAVKEWGQSINLENGPVIKCMP